MGNWKNHRSQTLSQETESIVPDGVLALLLLKAPSVFSPRVEKYYHKGTLKMSVVGERWKDQGRRMFYQKSVYFSLKNMLFTIINLLSLSPVANSFYDYILQDVG